MARALIARQDENPSAPIVVMAPGRLPADVERLYTDAGIPLLHDMVTGFDSLACYYAALPNSRGDQQTASAELPPPAAKTIEPLLRRTADGTVLSEWDSSEILRRAGIPMVESRRAGSAAEATAAASDLGYPVVIKALPVGIAHKDKLGLVLINIAHPSALEAEFAALEATLARKGFSPGEFSIILQPMVSSRIEFLAGVSTEPSLGHFLVYGLGGVHTEALNQVELLPVPASSDEIRDAVAASVVGRILSARQDGAALLDQFTAILDRLQSLVVRFGDSIKSIDINPVLVSKEGCIAVDALIVKT